MQMDNTTISIVLILISFIIIYVHYEIGITQVRFLENICDENIIVNYKVIKKYKFFTKNYYSVLLNFKYNDTSYEIKKGLFKEIKEEEGTINLHINSKNPNECYLIPLSERCNFR